MDETRGANLLKGHFEEYENDSLTHSNLHLKTGWYVVNGQPAEQYPSGELEIYSS
jgi:hypothetical protein